MGKHSPLRRCLGEFTLLGMVPLRAGTLFGTLQAFVPYHLIMREKIHNLRRRLITFEEWFDLRFGWFFTNGMKH